MKKTGPGAQPLPTSKDKKTPSYATPGTLAGKKGVESIGVKKPTVKDYSKREKMNEDSEKIVTTSLNTNSMKSLFQKFYEDVMSDADHDVSDEMALGIEQGDLMQDDEGSEGDGQVTLTLDRELAQKFYDMLGDVLGAGGGAFESEGGEEFESEGGEDESSEDEEGAMKESIEVVAEPKPLSAKADALQSKKNVPSSKISKTQGGKADNGVIKIDVDTKPLKTDGSKLQSHGHNKVSEFDSASKGTLFGVK